MALVTNLEQAVRRFRRRSVLRGVGIAFAGLVAARLPASADELPLAIRGYDPVAYFTTGGPAHGLPEIEYVWDELRFRFATAEHRDLFKADPGRYAPRFANFCAMALAKGIVHEADPEYWLVIDGNLYLFTAAFGPKLFQQDIAGNAAKADKNRPLLRR